MFLFAFQVKIQQEYLKMCDMKVADSQANFAPPHTIAAETLPLRTIPPYLTPESAHRMGTIAQSKTVPQPICNPDASMLFHVFSTFSQPRLRYYIFASTSS
jgi:hypothetical protein